MKQQRPKVTVLMSAYNSGQYIKEAIESILDQSFSDLEFLIFDDGSTDDTAKIVKEHEKKDSRIKAFYKEKNEGMPGMMRNLNEGMKLAQGQYIARMDADDISLPERLGTEVEFLDSNPDIFLVGTAAINIDEQGRPLSTFRPVTDPKQLKERLEKVASIYNPTIMFRTGSGLEYIPLKAAEDYHFCLMALKKGLKLANLSGILLHYRILPPSLSHGNPFQRLMHTLVAQDLYFGSLKTDQLSEDLIEARYNPVKCDRETLRRMVEVAYLSRSYDSIFKVASLYTERFGMNGRIMFWELISGIKMVLSRLL
jgi:glycosyltransferase involved in cell wall biosynthesis